MSEKPHTVAIGAFVFGALLVALITVVFVLGSGLGKERRTVVMVFDGSVKGLTVGAPVALRGVEIGQVTGIELILDADAEELIMLVEAEIRGDNVRRQGPTEGDLTEELIARGLRAQLKSQSLLTGMLYIQLDFHPDTPLNLAQIDSPYLQIPTIPTGLERLTREVEDIDIAKIADDLETTLDRLRAFVDNDAFQDLPARTREALASLTALGDRLQAQLASSGPRLDGVLDEATTTVSVANAEIAKLSALAQKNLEVLDEAVVAFEQAMREIDGMVSPDSATNYNLNRALREIAMAGRALQALARTLEEEPEALIRGKSGESP